MKIIKFNDFLNENSNQQLEDFALKNILFHNLSVYTWIERGEKTDFLNTDDTKSLTQQAEVIIEKHEMYNEEENPGQYVENKQFLIRETVALCKVIFQYEGKIDISVMENYIGTYIKYRDHWKDSKNLSNANDKTGIMEQ